MAYVLVIDDDEDLANAAATVLGGAGHEVAFELTIDGGLASMKNRKPDLLVLDVMFPESSSAGFDLARRVRHDDSDLKDVPILMLTAVNAEFPFGFSQRDIDDHWLPVSDFLEKPVDLDVLVKKVDELLGKAKDGGE